MTTTGKTRLALPLAALVVALAAFATPARAADLKPYRVGYNAWIGYIAFFVAQQQGYFKEEGLDIRPKSFSAPGDSLKPLLSGDLDVALSTADSVLTVLDKAPGQVRIVYLIDTSSGADAVLAKKDITDVKGMRGRKV